MLRDASFQIRTDARTSTVFVKLSGEIDIAVAENLQNSIDASLVDRPDAVVVDFGEVTFMDSTGIRFLIGFKNRCDAIGASWRLSSVSPPVTRLIELSGLSDFLNPRAD